MPDEPSRRPLRRLIPAARGSLTTSEPAVPERQKTVTAACEACRKRKVKCDVLRPQCSSCMRTKRVCQYTTQPSETRLSALKRRKEHAEQQLRDIHRSQRVHLQLIHALAASADTDAATIFQQLRHGCDPALILQRIEEGGLILQLRQPADALKHASADFAPDQADALATGELPTMARWHTAKQEAYRKLFERLKSASQERGVEILRRVHQGQDISDITHFVEDENLPLGQRC